MYSGIPSNTERPVLLKILQSIAYEQAALGSLAAAEVQKITGLIRQIEQQGLHSLGRDKHEFEKNFAPMLQAAINMHIVLQSKAQTIAGHLGIPYIPILGSDPKGEHHVVSCGQGTIIDRNSSFSGGTAILRHVRVVMKNEMITAGDIGYSVCHQGLKQTLVALPGTLRIDCSGLNHCSSSAENPRKVTIRGRAITKKRIKHRKAKCDDASFTFTLWDCGSSEWNHKFQMVITADKQLGLYHDSGIVDFTGIVQQKFISP